MSEDLKIKDQIDVAGSTDLLLPVGVIIPVAGSTYSTDSPATTGLCPCDGRSLNTYTYRALHAVISNTYGGTAYSAGTTDQPAASTTFNVPDLYTTPRFTAMKDTNVNLSSTAGGNTHTHPVGTNATGTTTNDGFDHSHTSYAGAGYGGDHGHSVAAAYVNTNTAAAHTGAGAKRDGPNSLASINHSHAQYWNGANTAGGGGHADSFYFNHGATTGTGHSHNYTTSGTTTAATTLPPYVTALMYIKI